jgi:hypothetical protein
MTLECCLWNGFTLFSITYTDETTALQASSEELAARDLATPASPASRSIQSSKRSDAIDAVNLNVDGDAGLTLTFVEEVDDEDDN